MMRKPQYKSGAMLHAKAGKLTTGNIINIILGVVILFAMIGTLWSTLGDGLYNATDAGLCAKKGGVYNTTTQICETSVGSGTKVSGFYANPFSDLIDPDNGLVFLALGASIAVIAISAFWSGKKK